MAPVRYYRGAVRVVGMLLAGLLIVPVGILVLPIVTAALLARDVVASAEWLLVRLADAILQAVGERLQPLDDPTDRGR